MKKAVILVLSLLFLAPSAHAAESPYHLPQTEAEKTLKEMLLLYDKDESMDRFIFGYPTYANKQYPAYSRFFTDKFLKAAQKQRIEEVKKSCGGKYPENGTECDFLEGTNPIICANDVPETYFFREDQKSKDQKILSYASYAEQDTPLNLYKMIKIKGQWKIDGVSCVNEQQEINFR